MLKLKQKKTILEMRADGKQFKEIAAEMNLPLSTVKVFVHRFNKKQTVQDNPAMVENNSSNSGYSSNKARPWQYVKEQPEWIALYGKQIARRVVEDEGNETPARSDKVQRSEATTHTETPRCAYCNELLPKGVPSFQRFCSNKCRNDWWHAHPAGRHYNCVCAVCGKEFISVKDKKYCSKSCYYSSKRKVTPASGGDAGDR